MLETIRGYQKLIGVLLIVCAIIVITFMLSKSNSSDNYSSYTRKDRCFSKSVVTEFEDVDWAWKNISVGSSNVSDLKNLLGEPTNKFSWRKDGKQYACIYEYSDRVQGSPHFWITNGTVVGFSFYSNGTDQNNTVDLTLVDLVSTYNEPDFIGFSTIYSPRTVRRSMIWNDEGIQIEIGNYAVNYRIYLIRYFAPIIESPASEDFWLGLVTEPSAPWENDPSHAGFLPTETSETQ